MLELNEANGGYGTFEVQLVSEPTAPLTIRLEVYGSGFCLPLWHNGSVEDAKSQQEGPLSGSCDKGSDLSDLPAFISAR